MSEEMTNQLPQDERPTVAALRSRRFAGFGDEVEAQRRQQRLVLMAIRTIFLALMVTVPLLPFVGTLSKWEEEEFTFWGYALPVMLTFGFGAIVLLIDAATPNK